MTSRRGMAAQPAGKDDDARRLPWLIDPGGVHASGARGRRSFARVPQGYDSASLSACRPVPFGRRNRSHDEGRFRLTSVAKAATTCQGGSIQFSLLQQIVLPIVLMLPAASYW